MYDVICLNVFPPQVNGIPPQRKGVIGASPTTNVSKRDAILALVAKQ